MVASATQMKYVRDCAVDGKQSRRRRIDRSRVGEEKRTLDRKDWMAQNARVSGVDPVGMRLVAHRLKEGLESTKQSV